MGGVGSGQSYTPLRLLARVGRVGSGKAKDGLPFPARSSGCRGDAGAVTLTTAHSCRTVSARVEARHPRAGGEVALDHCCEERR